MSERRENYKQKLLDPRWQKLRLRILERDDWTCQICWNKEETLHVHHRIYSKGGEPWDTPEWALVTLCATCHEEETAGRKEQEQSLLLGLARYFFHADINGLAIGFQSLEPLCSPRIVADAYSWALESKDAQQKIIDMYYDYWVAKHEKGDVKDSWAKSEQSVWEKRKRELELPE